MSRAVATVAWLVLSSCSSSRDPSVDAFDASVTDALVGTGTGDQSVFQDIAVSVVVAASENDVDPSIPDPVPTSLVEVRTGSGLWEDQVPGLLVFADGVELGRQIGAGVPQYFALSLRGEGPYLPRVTLDFRLSGSTFSTTIDHLDAQLVHPLPGEPVAAEGELVVGWTGLEVVPVEISASSPCMVDFVTETLGATEATLLLTDRRAPGEASCRGRLRAHWISEEKVDSTPFEHFGLRRSLGRTYDFELADGP